MRWIGTSRSTAASPWVVSSECIAGLTLSSKRKIRPDAFTISRETPEPQLLKSSNSSCPERARMFEELTAAMAAIIALSNREMEAVIAGKDIGTLDSFAEELQQMRERKNTLMFEY